MPKRILLALFLILFLTVSTRADYARIVQKSKEAAQIRVDLVEQAQSSIDASTLIFDNDTVSIGFMTLLRKKALENKGRNFQIRVLIDAMFNSMTEPQMKIFMESGIQIKVYNKPSLLHFSHLLNRLHDKILLTDNKNIVIGGRNFSSSYIQFATEKKNYVDRDVYVQSESVGSEVKTYFDLVWNSSHATVPNLGIYSDKALNISCDRHPDKSYRPICKEMQERAKKEIADARVDLDSRYATIANYTNTSKDPIVRLRTNNDWTKDAFFMEPGKVSFYHQKIDGIQKQSIVGKIGALMRSAQKSVYIDSGYLVLSKRAESLFSSLANRDVYVRITTNSLASNDSVIPQAAYYKKKLHYLSDLNLDVFEWKGPETLHAKSMVIDDKIAVIGTFNIEPRAEKHNREVMLVFEDERMASALRDGMEEYIKNSRHILKTGMPEGETEEFPGVDPKRIKRMKFFSHFIWILGPQL